MYMEVFGLFFQDIQGGQIDVPLNSVVFRL